MRKQEIGCTYCHGSGKCPASELIDATEVAINNHLTRNEMICPVCRGSGDAVIRQNYEEVTLQNTLSK